MTHSLGLSARTIRGVAPFELIDIAVAADIALLGVALDATVLRKSDKAALRRAFADSGVTLMDAEVIRLGHTDDADAERMLADAAEMGAPHFIVTCYLVDEAERLEAFGRIAELGRSSGIRPVLEFARFSTVPDLASALRTIEAIGPGLGLLVDSLHLERSGGRAGDLAAVPAGLMTYVQLCDAPALPRDGSTAGLLHEAREERLEIGQGALKLGAFVDALPADMPLMLEILSGDITARFEDATQRAIHIADTARRWLSHHEGEKT